MNTKNLLWCGMLLISILVVSCKKDSVDSQPVAQGISAQPSSSADSAILADDMHYLPDTSVVASTVLLPESGTREKAYMDIPSQVRNARSYRDIPTGPYYRLNPMYKISYRHLRQPDETSCSWTSYTILVGCLSNIMLYGWYSTPMYINRYPVTSAQVYAVKRWCGNSYITSLDRYMRNVDGQYVLGSLITTPNRFDAVKIMLGNLASTNNPFIVISTRGVGHYRIVCSLDWQGSEQNSWVYYMDCYDRDRGSFDANIQYMRFDSFLNLMIAAPNNYNMLFANRR